MAKGIRYGLDNPHPLSQLKTELVWEGKYDEYGNRRTVDVAGCAMPLQKIETVDEPRSRCQASGDLFNPAKAHPDDFRNMLIWGDNKLAMASLLKDFKGRIDLIYIDPPYDVGSDFTCDIVVGDFDETLMKDQSILEQVAYKDTWGHGVDSYLHMMRERLALMKGLLSERGSIFLHCDWHVGHYIRALLDDTFGSDAFLNEVVWYYYNKLHDSRKHILPRAHDVVFRYAKSPGKQIHHALKENREKPVTKLRYEKVNGRIQNIIGDDGKAETYTSTERTIDDVWRLRCLQPANKEEYTRFRTQKPMDLVQRVVRLASDDDSIVVDTFCGTGTTLLAAESLGRRWIGCDFGRFPIHLSRKRMIELQRRLHEEVKPYRAFDVYNLGRYERQWWQKERLKGADEEHRKVVLGFYKAELLPEPIGPLHGRKGRAFVHVDAIDGMLTRDEVRAVAKAAHEAGAKEVHCLAWEFEMDLRLVCNELEATEGVTIRLIPIPREIMEKNRTNPPPFLEVAVLEAEPVYKTEGKKRVVDIKLKRFMPSLAEVPAKELEALKERAVKSGFDFIDFWAVDFNYHDGKPFEHHWQDYRTRKDRSLRTVSDAGYGKYPKPGVYTACVKVVDVFRCDTSITVKVDTRG